MYQLVNVPTEASRCRIKAQVDGETIRIASVDEPGTTGLHMTSFHVGDHMLAKPNMLIRFPHTNAETY